MSAETPDAPSTSPFETERYVGHEYTDDDGIDRVVVFDRDDPEADEETDTAAWVQIDKIHAIEMWGDR